MLNKWSLLLLSNPTLYTLAAQVNTDFLWKFHEISLISDQKEGQPNSEMIESGMQKMEVLKSSRQKNVKTQTEGWLNRARIVYIVGRVGLGKNGSPSYQASKWSSHSDVVGPTGS